MKRAFLFPGQGSQTVGMGKELMEAFPVARDTFERAGKELGADFLKIIFEGPEETLRQTRHTQPALFTVSAAAFRVLKEAGVGFDAAAGHSLGEYSALYAAGAFDFETGLKLVAARGEAIQRASEKTAGAMAALVGLERDTVVEICRRASSRGICEPVNYNCPGQVVIAGESTAVDEAVELAKGAGAARSIKLNVSGPFHSSLMASAARDMAQVLETAPLRDARVPVVTNCDGRPTQSAGEFRTKLVRQIDHAVLWEDGIRTLFGLGIDTFVEVGPGRVLSGLLKRIDKTKTVLNIEDKKSADAVLAASPA